MYVQTDTTPDYASGPVCLIAIVVAPDGEWQTYTHRRPDGSAWVDPAGTYLPGAQAHNMVPTWKVRR